MKAILAALLCAISFGVQARDWTDSEKAWGAAFLATRVVDWGQTRHIATHPHEFREANPFLSDSPSMSEVNRHFIVGTLIMFGAAHYLPQYRSTLFKVWVSIGVAANAHNAAIGVRLEF